MIHHQPGRYIVVPAGAGFNAIVYFRCPDCDEQCWMFWPKDPPDEPTNPIEAECLACHEKHTYDRQLV